MRTKTLQVEGLTLQGNIAAGGSSGTAIYANFNYDEGANTKFQTATIRNVEIMGSDRTNTPAGYWGTGIWLYRTQNALIEDVQIHGYYDFTGPGPTSSVGINWSSSTTYASTQLFLHNIYVSYFQIGIATSGDVEGFYMSGFELLFCGYPDNFHAAMQLTAYNPNGRGPVFHISDGAINQISSAIRMSLINDIKISNVDFLNQKWDGTHVSLTDCSEVTITNNHFTNNFLLNPQTQSNGIYVFATSPYSSSKIIMFGNTFENMYSTQITGGSCIVLEANCRQVKILDTLFGGGT
jgi:hypothetical protein